MQDNDILPYVNMGELKYIKEIQTQDHFLMATNYAKEEDLEAKLRTRFTDTDDCLSSPLHFNSIR